ncbi:MAG: ABC transporter substrate-binding protein [Acidimicrobiales bacterium]
MPGRRSRPRGTVRSALVVVLLAIALSSCSSDSNTATGSSGSGPTTVRLGYFPNVTHAPAIVAVEKGFFARSLGANRLDTKAFNAGPEAIEALLSGAIDAAYVGPSPAINAYQKSKGVAIRIVAGSTSGGAALVVSKDINDAGGLEGKALASPQLGGTQDVALRAWLQSQGLATDTSGGGDVSIKPQTNGDTLDQFKQGLISGAWVPEPWATRLVQEGGGKLLVDEKSLWPQGQFVTTHLIVARSFLAEHPDAVEALIKGESEAIDFIAANKAEAQTVVNDAITKITGKGLKPEVITASFENLSFTLDPIASSLSKSADDAKSVGLLESTDIKDIYDLSLLNAILKGAAKPEVHGLP